MNTDAPWPTLDEAEARVLGIQIKLHRWATDSPDRRFDDLFNLVCHPASSWLRGTGFAPIEGHGQPESMG